MNTGAERKEVASPVARLACGASRARSLRLRGPGWRGFVLLVFLLYPALPGPAVASLGCGDGTGCESRLDRSLAAAATPWSRRASTNTDGFINLDPAKSSRRRLTMKRPDGALKPVEFEICGPQPLVDIFVEELGYHTKDLKKFDIYEVIAIIKEYFPCD